MALHEKPTVLDADDLNTAISHILSIEAAMERIKRQMHHQLDKIERRAPEQTRGFWTDEESATWADISQMGGHLASLQDVLMPKGGPLG